MQLDLWALDTSPSRLAAVARAVEAAGFDGLWVAETAHHAFVSATVAVTATERLTVGTDVAVAFARSPMTTAQAAWDLAELSGGRFVLGLGTQVKAHVERRFAMPFDPVASRTREYVRAVLAVFDAFAGRERLRFAGDHYALSLLPDFFAPGPLAVPDPPVYLAGVNAGMARLAGELCHGFHAHPLHSPQYLEQVIRPALAQGAASAGRTLAGFALVVPVLAAVGDDEARAAARARVRRTIGFYGSTPSYAPVFAFHGWGATADALAAALRAGDLDALDAAVTDEIVDAFSVSATWDELPSVLRRRYADLADRVVLYDTVDDASIARLADVCDGRPR